MRAALLLCALSLSARAAEVLLVADGAQSSRAVQLLRTEPVNGVRAAGGYPKVMKSDDLPGLKPGRLVTVLGVCDDRKAAQRVVNALKGKVPLSIRTVEGEWPSACPATDPPPPTSDVEAQLQRRLERDPSDEDARYDYAQYLQMAGRLDEAKAQLEKLFKLNPDHAAGRTLEAVIKVLESGGE
jgi:tetratricopeptide (TPR) repeat protein